VQAGRRFLPFVRGDAEAIECRALAAKRCLGVPESAALDPYAAAQAVGVRLFDEDFFERFSDGERCQVLETGAACWSAGTIIDGEEVAVILNPTHDPVRRRATLAEELAHIVIGHPPSVIDTATGMRTYDGEMESEAYDVGGAMLMPYGQLFALCKHPPGVEAIAARYGVSVRFTNYRINRCGLRRLYAKRVRAAGQSR
jgi:Zn-dependent peptidase ImmA (M78 family)